MTNKGKLYERMEYSVLDILGNIGGIMGFLNIIAELVIGYLCMDWINIKFVGLLKENLTVNKEEEEDLNVLNDSINEPGFKMKYIFARLLCCKSRLSEVLLR